MKNLQDRLRTAGVVFVAAVLVCGAVICTLSRAYSCGLYGGLDMIAAKTALPSGSISITGSSARTDGSEDHRELIGKNESYDNESKPESSTPEPPDIKLKEYDFIASSPTEKEIDEYDRVHAGEKKLPVEEFMITQGDIAAEGVQVKNSSSRDIDIKKELAGSLGFSLEDTDETQVLIYHTHTHESFLEYDTGYYYESFYPRSDDNTKNVCAVGKEIADRLNAAGITTIHDTTVHDNTYCGAYDRSLETIRSYLEKYPTIKVVLDIHRDGLGTDSKRLKPVCTVNGRKAAQIMILAGYNYEGTEEFRDWEYNLRFGLQLQKRVLGEYPDLLRPLYFGNFMYNMNVNTGSLLIEIGADSNTVDEVRYSGYLLGGILSDMLRDRIRRN